MNEVALRPSESAFTLTTVTETETAEPKPAVSTGSGNRLKGGEVPSQNTPSYAGKDIIKHLKSQPWYVEAKEPKLPKGKNARKRLKWRIRNGSVGALLELRIDKTALMVRSAP